VSETVWDRIERSRAEHNVLEHPFYVRWSAGELSADELARYAGQYRHATEAIAKLCADAAEAAPESHHDELTRHAEDEQAHIGLWDSFVEATGGEIGAEPTAETAECIGTWTAPGGYLSALARLYAIESGQPEISRIKIVCGLILARPFTPEARATPQPAKLLIAALAVGLPLIWLAQPLLAGDGPRAMELRFTRDLYLFGPVEGEIVRKQADILTFPPDVRVNRYELAKRLRTEVLVPWRDASRPLLEADTLHPDDTPPARLQAALRQYLRARERAISLRALSFETGDDPDEARALSAETELGKSLNAVNVLLNEGN
jgi:hypothetical protein